MSAWRQFSIFARILSLQYGKWRRLGYGYCYKHPQLGSTHATYIIYNTENAALDTEQKYPVCTL